VFKLFEELKGIPLQPSTTIYRHLFEVSKSSPETLDGYIEEMKAQVPFVCSLSATAE
jgi:hypothetical protein